MPQESVTTYILIFFLLKTIEKSIFKSEISKTLINFNDIVLSESLPFKKASLLNIT